MEFFGGQPHFRDENPTKMNSHHLIPLYHQCSFLESFPSMKMGKFAKKLEHSFGHLYHKNTEEVINFCLTLNTD